MTATQAQALILPNIATTSYIRVVMPVRTDPGPQHDFPGIRILDSQNHIVPYALDASPATTTDSTAQIQDYGSVDKKYTQLVADFGNAGTLRNQLRIVTSRPTFFTHVDIDGSDNRQTWTSLTRAALFYHVASAEDSGIDTIAFGPTRFRFFRIRILQTGKLFPVDSVSSRANAPPPQTRVIASPSFSTQGNKSRASVLFLHPYTQIRRIFFETSTPYFSRHVSLSAIGTQSLADTAIISRYEHGSSTLSMNFGGDAGGLALTVNNDNNPPLENLRAQVLGPVHWLIFKALPNETYRMVDLSAKAVAPHYDLSDLLEHEQWSITADARLGATHPADIDISGPSTPISQTIQSFVLPVVLLIALLAFGGLALASFRKPTQS